MRRTKATTASFSTVRGVVYEASTTPSMVRCSRVATVASNWLLVLQHPAEGRQGQKQRPCGSSAEAFELSNRPLVTSHILRCLICCESSLDPNSLNLASNSSFPGTSAMREKGQRTMSSWYPVYNLVKRIPRGRVTTYGALAKAIRLKGGARAAGHAMAACYSGEGIPWHRVVGAGGRLLISEPRASLQRRLLETEGVALTERRVNMKQCGWIPAAVRTKSRPRSKRPAKRRAPH